MSINWSPYRMKNLCSISSSKRIHAEEYLSEGVPFYRGKEIIEKQRGALTVSTDIFISKERFLEIKTKNGAPVAGDLLLTSVGTLGVPYVVSPSEEFYFKDGNLTWFRDFNGLLSKYLYYWFLSPDGKAELKKCTIGSSQQAFTIVLLKDIEICLPPLPTQRRIASVLSAYDDLIENNTRRIAILEEMARRLYEEWFVQFRFPGHETAEFDGELPRSWAWGRFCDVVTNIRSATRAGEHLTERRYVPVDCLPRRTLLLQDCRPWEEAQSSLILFEKNDILFGAMRSYFHKVVEAPFPGVTRSTCFVLRPAKPWVRSYAVMAASSATTVDYASAHSQGATIPYAVWDGALSDMPLILPDEATMRHFDDIVGPMLSLIQNGFFRLNNLRAQRDLLLPKLISGEIDVSNLPLPGTEDQAA